MSCYQERACSEVLDLVQSGGRPAASRVNRGKVAGGCVRHQAHLPACQVGTWMVLAQSPTWLQRNLDGDDAKNVPCRRAYQWKVQAVDHSCC